MQGRGPTMLICPRSTLISCGNSSKPVARKAAPSGIAALPFSRSASLNSLPRMSVAVPRASGGTMPAAITAAMMVSGAVLVAVAVPRPVTAKTYAALFTGPPMSNAIIAPSSRPSAKLEPPESPFSHSVRFSDS